MTTVRFNRLSVGKSYFFLALVEAIVLFTSLYLGFQWTSQAFGSNYFEHLLIPECIIYVIVLALAMAGMGLYHPRMRGDTNELLARVLISYVLGTATLALLFYFVPFLEISPRAIAIGLVLSFITICLIRMGFMRIDQTSILKTRILVLGAGNRAKIIDTKMRRDSDRRGFKIVGYVDMQDDVITISEEKLLPADIYSLQDYVQEHHIEEIVVAVDQRRGKLPIDSLYRCRIAGTNIVDIATFVERESGKIPINLMYPSWLIYRDGYRKAGVIPRAVKRLFDIAVSLIFFTVTWPVMLITYFLIKTESGNLTAPAFYTQVRVGRSGAPFNIYKFRSMRLDAEKDGAVWAMKNDNRITAVGAFIRKYRIDELPQLFNILRGDMSFIGPRPERPEFVDNLSEKIPYYGDRHQVKPGLTGWAQICYSYGSSDEDALEKLQYDLYYIKNYSLILDTIILIQTCEVIFYGKGAR